VPKKKPVKGKPKVNPDLEGLEIKVNEFGEIIGDYDIDKVNEFLDKNVKDKKLKDKKKNKEKTIDESEKEE